MLTLEYPPFQKCSGSISTAAAKRRRIILLELIAAPACHQTTNPRAPARYMNRPDSQVFILRTLLQEKIFLSPDGKFPKMDPVSKVNPTGSKLQLYSYFHSSCAWRVRIALNLKGLDYEYKAVNLLKDEQFSPEFSKLNPLNYVPVLVDEGKVIADSLAIILYLEEKYPQQPLLPQDLHKKAINFQATNIVAANIQPFQNRAVLKYIEGKVNADEKFVWAQYHIAKGLKALEKLLKDYAGKYATGDEVFLADLFLAPQIHAAINRFKLDMIYELSSGRQSHERQVLEDFFQKLLPAYPPAEFPTLNRLNEAYEQHPAFRAAMPDMQPDAVKP